MGTSLAGARTQHHTRPHGHGHAFREILEWDVDKGPLRVLPLNWRPLGDREDDPALLATPPNLVGTPPLPIQDRHVGRQSALHSFPRLLKTKRVNPTAYVVLVDGIPRQLEQVPNIAPLKLRVS